MLPHCLQHNL